GIPFTNIPNLMLMSTNNIGTEIWSTATYPLASTVNQLLYSSAANTITGLVTANNAVLVTSGAGVPSLSTTMPSAVQIGVNSLNSGTNANTTTYWGGNGLWTTPTAGIPFVNTPNLMLMSTSNIGTETWSTTTYPLTSTVSQLL